SADRLAMETEAAAREERQREAMTAELELALASLREEGARYIDTVKDRAVLQRLRKDESRAAARVKAEARRLARTIAGSAVHKDGAGSTISAGGSVLIRPLGLRGKVEQLRGDRLVVMVRGKRLTVERADCEALAGPGSADPVLPHGISLQRRPAESASEIRLVGLTVDEALRRVDKFLDDAALSDLRQVRLIHGLGSGRLKQAITLLLKEHPHVEGISAAPADQVGAGVTLVTLRT
ncbi:MAG TPA: Smr/MutS family protein, partial [Candidatus Polarisedimenticolia bacterium]|nr:Smr/MutS family protein [Candidatus Polarisedimenticolia bacterium]